MSEYDFIVCGSGIAGASVAAGLARTGRVALVERESAHGHHTTGRSAAMYIESYGNAAVRRLTLASRAFFDAPPDGFSDYPLLRQRGCMTIAPASRQAALEALAAEIARTGSRCVPLDGRAAREKAPVLRPEAAAFALFEPDGCDIDTHALHGGFLRMARAHGADIRLDAEIVSLERIGGLWEAGLAGGERISGRTVVNAAGAWADTLAGLAGLAPLGLQPLRRTAVVIDAPDGVDPSDWPSTIDVDEAFYFKPEAGRLIVSPADETPSPPMDAWPDDMDVALCIERLQAAADIPVRRIRRSWAGLRTFAPDRTLVIGPDPRADGFFWFAGQGGYGMQTAPAAAELAVDLALGRAPHRLLDRGVEPAVYDPGRLLESAVVG